MTDSSNYIPPKVWEYEANNMSTFSKTNRPIAGSTHEKMLPVGKHPLQLYSLATPNGVKVTILLEELIELGEEGAEYDAHLIRISEGDQFGSGFVDINPNSKIPALVDRSGDVPLRVFESGSILLYLAEKFNLFIPNNHSARTECLSWLFWQMGSAPYLGGGFGHFYHYANEKIKYPIDYNQLTKLNLDQLVSTVSMISPFSTEEKQKLIEIVEIENKIKALEEIINFNLFDYQENKTIQ